MLSSYEGHCRGWTQTALIFFHQKHEKQYKGISWADLNTVTALEVWSKKDDFSEYENTGTYTSDSLANTSCSLRLLDPKKDI